MQLQIHGQIFVRMVQGIRLSFSDEFVAANEAYLKTKDNFIKDIESLEKR